MLISKKKVWPVLLVAVFLLSTSVFCLFAAALANEPESGGAVQEIHIGDVIEVQPRELTYGGESKEAEICIVTPAGGKFSGKKFTADSAGKWTVEYSASFSGQIVSERIEYMCVLRPIDMLSSNGAAEIGSGAFSLDDEVKGISVNFRNGGSVSFTQYADLSGKTKEDVFMSLIVDPSKQGEADFSLLTVTLTDASDPSNYVTITLEDAGPDNCNGQGTFVRAAAAGQSARGMTAGEIRVTGTDTKHSFRGLPEENPSNILTLYYDDAEKAVYVSNAWDYRDNNKTLVADFDDDRFFPGNLWKGFSDGEVKIEVKASGFTSISSDVIFTNILGYDLAAEKYEDRDAPVIEVDYGKEQGAPNGYIGADYPIFPASVHDAFEGKIPVTVSVYYESSASSRTDVSVYKDTFKINYAGTYSIRYEATDCSGNQAELEVKVTAVSAKTPITVIVPPTEKQVRVYDTVTLPDISSVVVSGGSGTVSVEREIIAPDATVAEENGNTIRPDQIGEYIVRYTATDFLGDQEIVEQKIESEPANAPVIVEYPQLPQVLIEGFTYTLPEILIKEVSADCAMVEVAVKKYVNDQELAGNTFVANGETAEIKYSAEGVTGTTEYEVGIPVVDVQGGGNLTNYFYGTFGVSAQESGIALTSEGEAEAKFANLLGRNEITLEFFADSYDAAIKNFTIILTDSANIENTVSLKVQYADTGRVSISNGGNRFELTEQGGRYRFTYTNAKYKISDEYGAGSITVFETDSGNLFAGFAGAVQLTISADESGTIYLARIDNQSLSARVETTGDLIAPIIYFENDLAVKQSLGTEIEISAGEAHDVLGEIAAFSVTVIGPDKVERISGSAYENYTLILDQYGLWNVVYYAVDSNGNESTSRKMYRVNETEAPQLSVTLDGFKTEYGVGETVTIPQYFADDNSGIYTVNITLLLPDNQMRLLIQNRNGDETSYLRSGDDTYPSSFKVDDHTFKLEQAGRYTLQFFVYDEYYNCTTQKIVLTVK